MQIMKIETETIDQLANRVISSLSEVEKHRIWLLCLHRYLGCTGHIISHQIYLQWVDHVDAKPLITCAQAKELINTQCQCYKARRQKSSKLKTPRHLNDILYIDFKKVQVKINHEEKTLILLTASDRLSKWFLGIPVGSETQDEVIKCLVAIFSSLGKFSRIIADNGKAFTGQKLKEFLEVLGVDLSWTTPSNPTANYDERCHSMINRALRGKNFTSWQQLHASLLNSTITRNTTASSNRELSAFEMMSGRRRSIFENSTEDLDVSVSEAIKKVVDDLDSEKNEAEKKYPTPTRFSPGEKVTARYPTALNSRKFISYHGTVESASHTKVDIKKPGHPIKSFSPLLVKRRLSLDKLLNIDKSLKESVKLKVGMRVEFKCKIGGKLNSKVGRIIEIDQNRVLLKDGIGVRTWVDARLVKPIHFAEGGVSLEMKK